MIEVQIPKELDHYEAKFIGPFTLRQTICLVCALPSGVIIFNLAKAHLGVDVAGFLCLIPAGIAYLFGWLKLYGMKFEVFVRSVFVETVLAPSKRKYKINNYFNLLMSGNDEEDVDDFVFDEEDTDRKAKKKASSGKVAGYLPSNKAIF